MQILFLATNLPVPVTNGKAIRSMSIIQALAAQGHQITFVSFTPVDASPPIAALSSLCAKVKLVPGNIANLSSRSNHLGRLAALARFRSYSVERFRSAGMRMQIRQLLKANAFDCVFADGLYPLVNLPENGIPIVLNCHNVERMILNRYALLEPNPAKRIYARFEARRMYEAERDACRRSLMAMVCSEQDRASFRQYCLDLSVFVVPNCIDTDFITCTEQSVPDAAPTMLFQGGLDWYPNRDAVEFFVAQVLPSIRKDVPAARFLVAGRNPSKEFLGKFRNLSGVEFTGTVPDMRPFLSQATLVVVPLRVGSGTRIKILEAAAAGKPIVSTSLGAEGLEFRAGIELVLADKPEEFAKAVVSLIRDPDRRYELGRAARRRVVQRYSNATLGRTLENALASIKGDIHRHEFPAPQARSRVREDYSPDCSR